MKKATKKWLWLGTALILLGGIAFVGVLSMLQWDFSKLSTVQLETVHHEISEEFTNISVKADTADILFAASEDGICRVECLEEEKAKHAVSVRDGTLAIELNNQKHWYDYIGFHFASPQITVYLPKAEYASLSVSGKTGNVTVPHAFAFQTVEVSLSTGDVHALADASERMHLQTTTGSIRVEGISVGTLRLSASTGKVTVSNVTCANDLTLKITTGNAELTDVTAQHVSSSGSTGNLSLQRVVAEKSFSLQRSTGNIKLDRCDAAALVLKTTTGSVKGSLCTDKVFVATSSTGKIDVPPTTTGGTCTIQTDTGNITIKIQ